MVADEPWADRLTTGIGPWKVNPVTGHHFLSPHRPAEGFLAGSGERIDASNYPWGIKLGLGTAWQKAATDEQARSVGALVWGEAGARPMLQPAMLPPMGHPPLQPGVVRFAEDTASPDDDPTEAAASVSRRPVDLSKHNTARARSWMDAIGGQSEVVIAAGRVNRIVIDLREYACFYYAVKLSGGQGATVEVTTAESLYEPLHEHRKRTTGIRLKDASLSAEPTTFSRTAAIKGCSRRCGGVAGDTCNS